MGKAPLVIGLIAGIGLGESLLGSSLGERAWAQSMDRVPALPACPPDTRGNPPTVGGPSAPNLSDRLADSRGVICPPAGVDPGIQIPPPAQGEIKIIPAPGTPGGDPNVQPK